MEFTMFVTVSKTCLTGRTSGKRISRRIPQGYKINLGNDSSLLHDASTTFLPPITAGALPLTIDDNMLNVMPVPETKIYMLKILSKCCEQKGFNFYWEIQVKTSYSAVVS
jgi:hypothetical protein